MTYTIDQSSTIHGAADIGDGTAIDRWVIIGLANPYPEIFPDEDARRVHIGNHCLIYPWTLIYEGATIEDHVQVQERCTIGSLTCIGSGSRLVYGAQVHDHVSVGRNSVIGGFVADNCSIGDGSSIFGALVHRYSLPTTRHWDTTDEIGPTIGRGVVVGWGAVVVGDVKIGDGARIAPNSVITSDIAAGDHHVSR